MSHLKRIFLLTALLAAWALTAFGQDAPAPADETESKTPDRIVDGRPTLYSFKRALHPLTWVEGAFEPVFRSAEGGFLNSLLTRKPNNDKTSGMKFDVAGDGTGSGFGPQVTFFNKDLLGRGIDVEVPLLYTLSRYERYQFKASVPLLRESFVDRLSFDVGSGYSSRAHDDFFGIGNETKLQDDTLVRIVRREASAGLTVQFNDAWSSGLHAFYRNFGVTNPHTGHSAQQVFSDASVPGLFTGGVLRSAVFTIGQNTEKRNKGAFSGALDQLEISRNESAGKGDFSYWKYRLNVEHFFPLTSDGRKMIAARGLVETNRAMDGGAVPFFDMPALGSFGTLRGFENFRFRDKSAMAAGIEYRYRIWPAMDWGFFLDEGQVAPQLGDLGLRHFHASYGARLFVWPKSDFPISIDYGRSNETWRFYININTTF